MRVEELVFIGFAALVLIGVGYQIYAGLAGKSSPLPAEWQATLKSESSSEAVRSYSGDFTVEEYQPGYRLKLAYDSQQGRSQRITRVVLGSVFVMFGLATLYEYTRAEAHPEYPPEAFLFFAAVFVGGAVWAFWMPKLVHRVIFDGTVRQVTFERSSGAGKSYAFSDFQGALLREMVVNPRYGAPRFNWRLYLRRRSGLGKLVTESAREADRDESFRNAVPLARTIADLMKIPITIRRERLVSQHKLAS